MIQEGMISAMPFGPHERNQHNSTPEQSPSSSRFNNTRQVDWAFLGYLLFCAETKF
jgi:hypothetical protein